MLESKPMPEFERPYGRSKRAPRLLDAEELWSFALKSLGTRALSILEIRAKLTRRASDPADVETVLARLKEYKYLDDSRFAENYASARKENQGFGKMRVLRDLGQRKVGSTVAQKAVEQIFEGADETAMVEEFLARKFRNQKLSEYLQEPKHLAAAFRRLRYAGFSSTVSIRVLKKYAAQAEDLESLDEPDTEAVE